MERFYALFFFVSCVVDGYALNRFDFEVKNSLKNIQRGAAADS